MDSHIFRETLAQFATGVTVVISGTPGAIHGMTVNSFTSVSLDPPLVLLCADNRSDTYRAIKQSQRFTVSILSDQQESVSQQFALIGPQDELFAQIACASGIGGVPYLLNSLGYLDCAVQDIIPAGDHHIILGHVDHLARLTPGYPLLYFKSQYYYLGTSPPD